MRAQARGGALPLPIPLVKLMLTVGNAARKEEVAGYQDTEVTDT